MIFSYKKETSKNAIYCYKLSIKKYNNKCIHMIKTVLYSN